MKKFKCRIRIISATVHGKSNNVEIIVEEAIDIAGDIQRLLRSVWLDCESEEFFSLMHDKHLEGAKK